jgi:DNA-binding MarR family transcriptional regulator
MTVEGEQPPRKGRFDSRRQEAYLALWRSYDRLRMAEDEVFARHSITPQQYNILRILQRRHPDTLPTLKLAARLVSRAPDITRMVTRLEERGLVTRRRPPDNRRVVEIGLTPEGLALLDELAEPVRRCHEAQLGHLDDDELTTLIDLLRRARRPHEPDGSVWRD